MSDLHAPTNRYRPTNLALVLDHQGRTWVWLAEHLSISPGMVTKMVKGERVFTAERARRTAAVLDLPVEVLFEPIGESSAA